MFLAGDSENQQKTFEEFDANQGEYFIKLSLCSLILGSFLINRRSYARVCGLGKIVLIYLCNCCNFFLELSFKSTYSLNDVVDKLILSLIIVTCNCLLFVYHFSFNKVEIMKDVLSIIQSCNILKNILAFLKGPGN